MMWTMLADGTLVSERDERGRRGVLFTGKAVTSTQARSGFEAYPYYGHISTTLKLPSPTRNDGLIEWGTVEKAMAGVENWLAIAHAEEVAGADAV